MSDDTRRQGQHVWVTVLSYPDMSGTRILDAGTSREAALQAAMLSISPSDCVVLEYDDTGALVEQTPPLGFGWLTKEGTL